MDLKEIIEKLEQTRIEKKLSYDDVAMLIKSTRANVWKVLTRKAIPKGDTFIELLKVLKPIINLNQLLLDDLKMIIDVKEIPRKTSPNVGNYKPKQNTKKKVEVLENCPNCKYEKLKSGISILLKKCDECKRKK